MFARFNHRQVPTEQLDDILQIYRDKVAPDRLAQKGNKGAYVFVDRNAGKIIGVSLWETEADMNAAQLPTDVDNATGSKATVETYEVVVAGE